LPYSVFVATLVAIEDDGTSSGIGYCLRALALLLRAEDNGAPVGSGQTNGVVHADHGKEDAKLRVHVDNVSVSEDELRPTLLLAREHDRNLLRGD